MAIKVSDVLVGCDPEVAVFDSATKLLIPAWELVDAKKGDKPHQITKLTSVHADGVALEFNMTPCSIDLFGKNVRRAYEDVLAYVAQQQEKSGHKLAVYTVAEATAFSKATLEHPLANIDGCDPDFCAYNSEPMTPRERAPLNSVGARRFFGGHIHVGYDQDSCPPFAMARLLDMFVYAPLARHDMQGERKKMYGTAGLFRPKSYGMEYRTPSNFWLVGEHMLYIVHNMTQLFNALQKKSTKINKFFNDFDWTKLTTFLNQPSISTESHKKFVDSILEPVAGPLGIQLGYP